MAYEVVVSALKTPFPHESYPLEDHNPAGEPQEYQVEKMTNHQRACTTRIYSNCLVCVWGTALVVQWLTNNPHHTGGTVSAPASTWPGSKRLSAIDP